MGIANLAQKKNIDIIVMGRRGLSSVTRFFVGSTTTYVLEHAQANVLVVKQDLPPEEVHESDVRAVKRAEEVERARRIDEERVRERQEAFRSALDKNVVVMAEEEERMRRIKEDTEAKKKEASDREAAAIGAKIRGGRARASH